MTQHEIRLILAKLEAVEAKVETLTRELAETKDVVEAWATVKRGAGFLKWLGGVLAAALSVYTAFKTGLNFRGQP